MRIIINNEDLEIEQGQVVTFKKTQKLNGLQEGYSFTNNLKINKSPKNIRILKSSYFPTTKGNNMANSIECDAVMNDTIYLKKQQFKIKKDLPTLFEAYVIFSESYFMTKAKDLLMNDINFGTAHTKSVGSFMYSNEYGTDFKTAPISAQDKSGIISIQEYNILINVKFAIQKIFTALGYTLAGDYSLDADLPNYYFSSDVGWYGTDGTAQFSDGLTAYDFLQSVAETFNGFIDASDSSRNAQFNLWKNFETMKDNFVDYSDYFDDVKDYTAEDGLAKKNTVKYSEGSDAYNSFFNNQKSLTDEKTYLTSDFGAGNMRLFDDQEIKEDGTIELREVGTLTDAKKLNLYVFETEKSEVSFFDNGIKQTHLMYKAYSPNMLEIWQKFHKPYTDNIAQPVIANFEFKYNALFLNDFKMQEVFFIKQLSSYWLPLEINFSNAKDGISLKAILIQKTVIYAPIVYDLNLSIGFYDEVYVVDQSLLYSTKNKSKASSITIQSANLSENYIFVNTVEITSLPVTFDVSTVFEIRIVNKNTVNVINNSDIIFQYTSEEGGVSRLAKINVAHNGSATYVSNFRSLPDVEYSYGAPNAIDRQVRLNYCGKVTPSFPINIPTTLSPQIGYIDNNDRPAAPVIFKALAFNNAGWVTLLLTVGQVRIKAWGTGSITLSFNIWRGGVLLATVYQAVGTTNTNGSAKTTIIDNVTAEASFYTTGGGQDIYIEQEVFYRGIRASSLNLPVRGTVVFKNANYEFTKIE